MCLEVKITGDKQIHIEENGRSFDVDLRNNSKEKQSEIGYIEKKETPYEFSATTNYSQTQ